MHAGDRVTPGRLSWKPRFAHARAGLLIAGILLPGRSTTAQAISTDSAAPTFTRDIAPLVFEHCAVCHRPGGSAPFSLVTYDDARARARQIVTASNVAAHAALEAGSRADGI
jgi:mono/diheme cytochrome c family protein